jgi:hypothetical protein
VDAVERGAGVVVAARAFLASGAPERITEIASSTRELDAARAVPRDLRPADVRDAEVRAGVREWLAAQAFHRGQSRGNVARHVASDHLLGGDGQAGVAGLVSNCRLSDAFRCERAGDKRT